jgi:hypothetical protein
MGRKPSRGIGSRLTAFTVPIRCSAETDGFEGLNLAVASQLSTSFCNPGNIGNRARRFGRLHAFNLRHGFCGDWRMADDQSCENQRDRAVNNPEGDGLASIDLAIRVVQITWRHLHSEASCQIALAQKHLITNRKGNL